MRQAFAVWRIMPAINAALLAVSAVAFSLASAEGSVGMSARGLGYDGETVRIVAVQEESETGASSFTQPLVDFSETHGLSVAYSAYSESGVVALYDPALRYQSRSSALFAPFAASGSEPAAVLSAAVPEVVGARSGLLPDGVTMLGTFSSEVQFDSRYPVVLENLAAGQPGSGVYLIAGLGESDRTALTDLFSQNGMEIKNLAVQKPVTVKYILSTLYGGIVVAFAILSVLAALLVTHVHSFLLRRHVTIAAVLGASAGDLRRLLLGRLVPLVTIGTAGGALIELGILLSIRHAMQTTPGTVVNAFAASLMACVLLWVVILAWVSTWEIRRCCRAVSC